MENDAAEWDRVEERASGEKEDLQERRT